MTEVGYRFGSRTVVEIIPPEGGKPTRYKCLCDCGNQTIIAASRVHKGLSQRCIKCQAKNRILPGFKSSINKVFHAYKKNAASRSIKFELELNDIEKLIALECHYCGKEPSNVMGELRYSGIDRVNNDLGYSLDNCVPCCKTCNIAKATMTTEEWYDWIKRLVERHG